MDRKTNIREFSPSMDAGKNPTENPGIKGSAKKDSLTGSNSLKEYKTSGSNGTDGASGKNLRK